MKKKNKEGKPNLVFVLPSRSNDWNVKLCFSLKEKLSVAAKRKKNLIRKPCGKTAKTRGVTGVTFSIALLNRQSSL